MTQPKLNDFCKEVFEANKLKGFDVSKENVGQSLMLIVSELSEALEAHRKERCAKLKDFKEIIIKSRIINNDPTYTGNVSSESAYKAHFESFIKDTFEDEIADTAIRLFDLCGAFEIDIEWHIEQKLKYNALRPYKHGKKY